jgi:two-component system sensor histidine kinase KdpD
VRWRSYLLAGLTVGALVGALRLVSVEAPGIAAPLLLLDVVVVARFTGTGPALFAAAIGAASYSYYFLPPAGFAIADPDDWIEFITFIVTAVVAGELASRAERRTAEAQAGRLEIERLYQELQAAFDRASEVEAERQNEQLKAALLEAVTHNLRTPLTSIKAAVTALIGAGEWSRTGEISSEGRGELLEIIDEESDRLNRFIEGLSTSDRADRAEPLHLRAVPVDTIARTAIHRAGTVTRAHRVNLVLDADLPSLSVDAPSASEVLYILLDNASKYSPAGSTIVVRGTKRGDERYVRLTVSDEGPGIPEELSERVFEKFFRVPGREPYDRRRGGVGLGLLIARRLVEAQGGRIWVEASGAVRGTTIALMLPVAVEGQETDRANMVAAAAE